MEVEFQIAANPSGFAFLCLLSVLFGFNELIFSLAQNELKLAERAFLLTELICTWKFFRDRYKTVTFFQCWLHTDLLY